MPADQQAATAARDARLGDAHNSKEAVAERAGQAAERLSANKKQQQAELDRREKRREAAKQQGGKAAKQQRGKAAKRQRNQEAASQELEPAAKTTPCKTKSGRIVNLPRKLDGD